MAQTTISSHPNFYNPKLSRLDAPARFEPAFKLADALREEFSHEPIISGTALRELYFEREPTYYDVFLPTGSSLVLELIYNTFNKLYQPLLPPDNAESLILYGTGEVRPIGYFMINGTVINLVAAQIAPSQGLSCNNISLFNDELFGYSIVKQDNDSNGFQLHSDFNVNRENVEGLTEAINDLEEKLNLKLGPLSRDRLELFDLSKFKHEKQVIGYRTFNISQMWINDESTPRVTSPVHYDTWETKTLVAECDIGDVYAHLVEQSCRCGINMFKDIIESSYLEQPIVAECKALGVVGKFEKGYRAEKAEITQMWLLRDNLNSADWYSDSDAKRPAIADELQTYYGVPVNVTNTRDIKRIVSARSNRVSLSAPPERPSWMRK